MKLSITICVVYLLFNIQSTICYDSDEDNDSYDGYVTDEFISNIGKSVTRQLNGLLENLDQLQSKIDDKRKRVNEYGDMIEKKIEMYLEPLNAIVIKSSMAQGVGGATIATYGGKIKLVLMNKKKYDCTGEIYTDQKTKEVKCTKSFVPRKKDPIDVCTESSYSQVNDFYCFGDYDLMQCINGDCQCTGGIIYKLKSLQNQCGPSFGTNNYVKYEYHANVNDPTHIPIPNPNKYVTCQENENGSCTWYGISLLMS